MQKLMWGLQYLDKVLECISWALWTRRPKSLGDSCHFYSDLVHGQGTRALNMESICVFSVLYITWHHLLPETNMPLVLGLVWIGSHLCCSNCLPSLSCDLFLSGVWCVYVGRRIWWPWIRSLVVEWLYNLFYSMGGLNTLWVTLALTVKIPVIAHAHMG